MLSDQQLTLYLHRLGYGGGTAAELGNLRALHRAHMQHVPFENLDIHLGRKIKLTTSALFDKLVLQGRGGFCYELNYLFGELLTSLGFEVQRHSARVYRGQDSDQAFGPDFDHMLLSVTIQGETLIADVGFGDSFLEALPLQGEPLIQGDAGYAIQRQGSAYVLLQQKQEPPGGEWQPQYLFDLTPYEIGAFEAMCSYQQTSPESAFTQKTVCSIATADGRNTISNRRFITTRAGVRSERLIANETDYRQILERDFNIILPPDASLERLLAGPGLKK
ncbi:MAG: arylamine N-acetyltransferase [Pseudomonadota bacterium]